MTYEAVLFLFLALAALNRAARPFALVMAANWAVNYAITGGDGLYVLVPAVDALAFAGLACLTMKHKLSLT